MSQMAEPGVGYVITSRSRGSSYREPIRRTSFSLRHDITELY